MKYLMKTLLPLLGTEKIGESCLTPNFIHKFQQQKKIICKNTHGLRLTQNLYTLVVMKYLMKTLLPLFGPERIEENCFTPSFSDSFQQQKKNI